MITRDRRPLLAEERLQLERLALSGSVQGCFLVWAVVCVILGAALFGVLGALTG